MSRWISVEDKHLAEHGKRYLCATRSAYVEEGYWYSVYLFVKNGREHSEDMKTDGPVFCSYDSEYGYIEQEPDYWCPIDPVNKSVD